MASRINGGTIENKKSKQCMNTRSKKYHDRRRENKGTANDPAPKTASQSKKITQNPKEGAATQDDTGGGNDSGKRSDEN